MLFRRHKPITSADLVVDAHVISSDGIPLGHVGEVLDDVFRVDAPPGGFWPHVYWLPIDAIAFAKAGLVAMSVPSRQVAEISVSELRAA